METIELYVKEESKDKVRRFSVNDSNGINRSVSGYRDLLETVAGLPHLSNSYYKLLAKEGISSDESAALEVIVNMKNQVSAFKCAQEKTLALLF